MCRIYDCDSVELSSTATHSPLPTFGRLYDFRKESKLFSTFLLSRPSPPPTPSLPAYPMSQVENGHPSHNIDA